VFSIDFWPLLSSKIHSNITCPLSWTWMWPLYRMYLQHCRTKFEPQEHDGMYVCMIIGSRYGQTGQTLSCNTVRICMCSGTTVILDRWSELVQVWCPWINFLTSSQVFCKLNPFLDLKLWTQMDEVSRNCQGTSCHSSLKRYTNVAPLWIRSLHSLI
jgi:hypothetical protein